MTLASEKTEAAPSIRPPLLRPLRTSIRNRARSCSVDLSISSSIFLQYWYYVLFASAFRLIGNTEQDAELHTSVQLLAEYTYNPAHGLDYRV